jgi:hypothetical protein
MVSRAEKPRRADIPRALYFTLCVSLTLAFLAIPSYSQNATSTLVGLLTDTTGAVVPNAKITVTNLGTGISRITTTNSNGEYTVPFLDIGQYKITAETKGFQTFTLQRVSLGYEQTIREDISLSVGAVTQQVTVEASAPLLNTENATQNAVIDQQKLNDLPLNGRNFIQLTQLVPGTTPGNAGAGNTSFTLQGFAVSANGQRDFNNTYTLDGMNMTESRNPSPAFNPSIDALQEFNMQVGLYGAEYGTRAGAQVDLALKSGTNKFHGDVYEFLRNSKFNSRNFFNATVPPLDRSQFGATLGGPVRKDRTFFFAAYDGTRQAARTALSGVVPTASMLQGDFSSVTKPVINPATGLQFPGNIVTGINSISKALAGYYPAPTQAGVTNYSRLAPAFDNDDQFFARVDHRLTNKDNLFGHFAYARRDTLSPAAINPFGTLNPFKAVNFSLQNTHIFTPSTINQVQIGYNRYHREIDSQQRFPNVASTLALPGVDPNPALVGFPVISVTGYAGLGEYTYAPLQFYNELKEVKDTLSMIRGSHTIKVGTDITRYREQQAFPFYPRGQFGFTGYASGNAVADLLLGLPQSSSVSNGLTPARIYTTFYHFFGTDEWKVTRKLTLNIGLRYEADMPVQDQRGLATNFNPTTGTLFPTLGTRQRLYNFDNKDFAPRFSFAYRPFGGGTTVVRGGYGIFYSMPEFNAVVDFNLNPPLFSISAFTASSQVPLTFSNPFPSTGKGAAGAATVYAVDQQGFRNGLSQLWSLSVQRKIASNLMLEAGYTGGRTDGLLMNSLINQPLPGAGSVQPRRPYPAYASINYWVPGDYATYHALLLKAERRFSNGLYFLASYTWSKSLDIQQSGIFGDSQSGGPQNKNNLRGEYGMAPMDYRQRFVVSYGYELPFGKGKRFLSTGAPLENAFLGGWQINGVTTAMSGAPFTLTVPGDPAGIGGTGTLRPNRIANGNLPSSQRTVARWFDTLAFVLPPAYSFGSSGRNVLISPGLLNFDFSLFKGFKIGESKRIEFRAEYFNLFNHPQFGIPGQSMGTTSLGVISSANGGNPARIGQLALKIYF